MTDGDGEPPGTDDRKGEERHERDADAAPWADGGRGAGRCPGEAHAGDGRRPLSRRGFVAGAASAAAGAGLAGLGVPGARAADRAGTGGEGAGGTDADPEPVPTRSLGRSGVEVPIVGVGCGSRFYGSIPDGEAAAKLLREAIDRGVELVETSANYGPDGLSERWVGRAMETHRDRVFLETKIDARDHDGAMREMERSLRRMRTDRLDLVLHHFLREPGVVDRVARPDGADAAIRRMVEEGVVRLRGFSTHVPELALRGIERLEPDAVQLPLNAVRVPDFESGVLPAAAAAGVGVLAMKTCGNGYFHPAHATEPDRIERYGPPEGAWDRWDLPTWTDYIHYALSLPVATAVIGVDSYFTLDGIVAAARGFDGPLPEEELASISERAQVFRSTGYWIPSG